MASGGQTRFLRMGLGHKKLVNGVIPGTRNGESYGSEAGTSYETTVDGIDGMGMAGNNFSIMDHCSISWTIDEAFSSRSAQNVTLQRTLISEDSTRPATRTMRRASVTVSQPPSAVARCSRRCRWAPITIIS